MIRDIVERHASEAAMLWSLRDAAVLDAHYDLDELATLDLRVEAHLDGLRIAGASAWDAVKGILEGGLEEDQAGDVFAAATVATDHGDLNAIAKILDVAGESPVLRRGIVSALGWLPFEVTSGILPGLLDRTCPAALTALGIAACAAHRASPGDVLGDALYSEDERLLSQALYAGAVLGQGNVAARARAHLDHASEAVRVEAAFALALLGDVAPAVDVLAAVAARGGPHADRACVLAARRGDPGPMRALVEGMARQDDAQRRAVLGAGALGDAVLVPWLLRCMQKPELARVAGESFTMITGANLAQRPLRGTEPEGFEAGPSDDPADEDVAMDPDGSLPWPNVPGVEAWWAERRARFQPGVRHLLGSPIALGSGLSEVLRRGLQRQRAAAALELAFLQSGKPLFEVRAPGFRQRAALPERRAPARRGSHAMSDLCIGALGMVSALGHDVASSCAAARAQLSNAGEIQVVGQPFGKLTMDGPPPNYGHQVPDLGTGFSGAGKVLALGVAALRDLLAQRPLEGREPARTGLLLCVADHAVIDAYDARLAATLRTTRPAPSIAWRERARTLAEELSVHAELGLAPANCAATAEGGPGFARALSEAASRIARGSIDRCIVGAVDSRVEPRFLVAAADLELLRTNDRAVGLIGGEAAAFALVERDRDVRARRALPLASIAAVAHAIEPTGDFGGAPAQGRALASAVLGVISSSPSLAGSLALFVTDLNGTERRAYAWGMALARLRTAGVGDLPAWTPAMSFGDVGAAAGAVGLCVAVRAFARGYAPGGGAIAWAHSESGAAAAIGVEAPPAR